MFSMTSWQFEDHVSFMLWVSLFYLSIDFSLFLQADVLILIDHPSSYYVNNCMLLFTLACQEKVLPHLPSFLVPQVTKKLDLLVVLCRWPSKECGRRDLERGRRPFQEPFLQRVRQRRERQRGQRHLAFVPIFREQHQRQWSEHSQLRWTVSQRIRKVRQGLHILLPKATQEAQMWVVRICSSVRFRTLQFPWNSPKNGCQEELRNDLLLSAFLKLLKELFLEKAS